MRNSDYMDATARTETDDYSTVKMTVDKVGNVCRALFGATRTGAFSDRLKKAIFYGKEEVAHIAAPRDIYQWALERMSPSKVRLIHHTLGIMGEAGEIAEHIYAHVFNGQPLDKVAVMGECGDLLWYMSGMLDELGFDFSVAMERNIAKLRARYPHKFGLEQGAAPRNSEAERAALEGR